MDEGTAEGTVEGAREDEQKEKTEELIQKEEKMRRNKDGYCLRVTGKLHRKRHIKIKACRIR
jgi:hypothetical protein